MAKQDEKAGSAPATQQKKQELAVLEKTITDQVLARVQEFQKNGAIRLPKDYSPENAVKTAWLVLLETTDRNGKPVLEVCTKPSIANATLKMILLGLNPMKKQCDFVAYGTTLTLQVEYHGNIALAKRLGDVKNATANVIYEGDKFAYEIDTNTGFRVIKEHIQNFENIDNNKIKGAYAVLTFENDSQPYVEIMNMMQIRQAWQQGATKGNSPAHKNFPEEMAKKSVISRACKLFITSSDDGALYNDEELKEDIVKETAKQTVSDNAHNEHIDMDDAEYEDVTTQQQPEQKQSEKQPETQQEPQANEPPKQTQQEQKAPEGQQGSSAQPGRMF